MKFLSVLLSIILLSLSYNGVLACTIFSASDGTTILGGNNGDHSDADTYIVFYPPENGKHGRMYAGWKQFWWQTGINDQGLFFASASAPYLKARNSTQKPSYSGYLMYKCMEECATVNDVLAIFDQYNLKFLETMQLLIADATGASVIIEGDAIYHKQHDYQVVTNFRLSQTNPPYPCWRYNTAMTMLETTPTISPDVFTAICDATHVEGYTQFSMVYDLPHKIIYLYWQYNYTQVKIFNLTTEIQSGYHIYSIQSLFTTSTPPATPTTPQGTRHGTIGQTYTYTTSSTDSDGDQISYVFDWGDGTISEWLGPYNPGILCEGNHVWDAKGTYNIKVKAKDSNGAESDWSDPLPITMPYSHHKPLSLVMESLVHRFPYAFPLFRQLRGYEESLFFFASCHLISIKK